MTINSVITNLCWQFGKVTHTDKMLADKCRLISAILGQGWKRVDRDEIANDLKEGFHKNFILSQHED